MKYAESSDTRKQWIIDYLKRHPTYKVSSVNQIKLVSLKGYINGLMSFHNNNIKSTECVSHLLTFA